MMLGSACRHRGQQREARQIPGSLADWAEAERAFQQALTIRPRDGAAEGDLRAVRGLLSAHGQRPG